MVAEEVLTEGEGRDRRAIGHLAEAIERNELVEDLGHGIGADVHVDQGLRGLFGRTDQREVGVLVTKHDVRGVALHPVHEVLREVLG